MKQVTITKAPTVKEPIILKREGDIERHKQKLMESVDPYPDMWKLSFFDKVGMWVSNGAKYSKIIFLIIDLIIKVGVKMENKVTNDKKTTNAGVIQVVVAAISGLVALVWGKDIPAEAQVVLVSVASGIYFLAGFFGSWFTNKKDAK